MTLTHTHDRLDCYYLGNLWGRLVRPRGAGRVPPFKYPVRVGILKNARRKNWYTCLDEAVRAPQPVTPARLRLRWEN
jgi:hypothetical protein